MAVSLTDRINALECLILSHVRATTEQSTSVLKNTCEMAEAYAQAYDQDSSPETARQIRRLIRDLRIQGNLPAND